MKLNKRTKANLKRSGKTMQKPFIRYFTLPTDYYMEDTISELIDILSEIGITIYQDPVSENDRSYFVSNVPLTYKWLRDNYCRYVEKSKKTKTKLNEFLDVMDVGKGLFHGFEWQDELLNRVGW